MKGTRTRAKNDVIGSRRSEPIILSDFLPQFYQGRVCKYTSRTPAIGGHFGDKSKMTENAIIFSISLLGEEIYRMYWVIPCDVTTSRNRVYKRRKLKGGSSLEFRLQCELESW
ncbi:hypothetical protein AVEN_70425-1 [Araneus ventricosus]|uniref:Uncharacterized protein n=1 Tax=Araneus ventricosus TaxID=182803 RepID=A0A4Y2HVW0_ARAVE|nr:hypothetical protein AVEN_22251-1 [Araneus ventricosus]GBM69595.1 hypothetical protein AVEN_79025-1 [Araneus ventricosus]GBM70019.1 hypothetical protein AVEN_48478-1 [Araneus ventricosus]GBM70039.1 hypothetical protein AVEN_70425-1 [Araneus ventricosus]